MKKAVHFGAGKIGRGFIAELLHDSGYEVIFADVTDSLIKSINTKHKYSLFRIDHDYEEKVINNVSAYSSIKEENKIITEICDAKILTTSVMASNLPKIAPLIARGLYKRFEMNKEKLIVMACENAIMGTDILKKTIAETNILTMDALEKVAVYPNTAVDRMVFDGNHNGKKGVEISDAYELAIERKKLVNPYCMPITGAEYVDNIEKYLLRKIYIVNCGHAISAYLGQVNGYDIVQDVLHTPDMLKEIKEAMLESAAALERKYDFSHEELMNYIDCMMIKRFSMPGITDSIERVGREPIRKLSLNDRILGPAYLCETYGLPNKYLLKGAACALCFKNPDDKQAVEMQKYITQNGIEAAITKYTGVASNSRMFATILEEYKKIVKI